MMDFKSQKTLTVVLYAMYIAAIFSAGIFAVIALIINYVKRDDVKGTIFESHFTWQIQTVWKYLIWNIIGIFPFFLLFLVQNNEQLFNGVALLSFIFLIAVVIISWLWIIYRAIKGLIKVNENKAIY
ncbi:DUF4870 family protein [Acinetobacter sp. HY1485]|uniref:DUF4870 family protein n=1 Tax=Acinetobacter sp. HY1485 TaxID=2970918 RepID=UPI0022B9A85C|nr:hypothetical protein [Acinetobacter sp. HY1485]